MESKSTRRRFSAPQKAQILKACERSGLTRAAFAAQQGIGLSSLYQWLRQSRDQVLEPSPPVIDVPNPLIQSPGPAPYRLHLGPGRLLEVGRGFEPSEVRLLAQLLQSL